jgi:hypothetical protein
VFTLTKINIRAWIVTCAAVFTAALPPLSAQTQVDLRTQTKSADLSSVGATKPAQTGSALPATCGVGEVYFLTSAPAGTNLRTCASTNQWTASGGGSIEAEANGTSAGTATSLNFIPGTYLTQTVGCANGGICTYQPDVDTTKIPTNAAIQAGQLLSVISGSSSATSYTGVMAANDPLATYTANQQLIWNVGSTSCAGGAMTLNIDGLGAIPLKLADGSTNFTSSQCPANAQIPITYDGVNNVFRGPSVLGIPGTSNGSIVLSNSGSTATDTVTLASPVITTGAYSFTLPTSGGTNGYVLKTDGGGNTSWVAQSGGIGGTYAYSAGNTSANSMTGSYVNIWSVSNVPALAAGSCYQIMYTILNGISGGYPTHGLILAVDGSSIADLESSVGSASEVDTQTFLYCNNAGSQTAQNIAGLYGSYCSGGCGGGGAGTIVNYSFLGATSTPTAVTWSTAHTIAIQAKASSGTVTGFGFRIGQ